MSKLLLIIEREYMSIAGRKSFLVMTLLIPVLMVLLMFLPSWLAEINKTSTTEKTAITVIDETGQLAKAFASNEIYDIVPLKGEPGKTNPKQFFKDGPSNMEALVVIPAHVLDSAQVNVYSSNTLNAGIMKYIEECLADTLTTMKLQQQGIAGLDSIVRNAQVDLNINSVKIAEDGSESDGHAEVAMVLGIALSFVIYMFVITYGAMIMNSVVEEKTNRIVEVIVSSCKPFQLMMGKIIGVGLVGLTQFTIWVVILAAVMSLSGITSNPDSPMGMVNIAIEALKSINIFSVLAFFVIYFIGGYLLYASLFAGFGSAVDQASDTSQFMTPILLIMIVALYAGIGCMENPNGTMAVWCSIIPFTSPIVMMVRLPYEVPLWQMALSIGLLFATALAMIWVSARIYRTGILLYGKKHSFKDIIKWIK